MFPPPTLLPEFSFLTVPYRKTKQPSADQIKKSQDNRRANDVHHFPIAVFLVRSGFFHGLNALLQACILLLQSAILRDKLLSALHHLSKLVLLLRKLLFLLFELLLSVCVFLLHVIKIFRELVNVFRPVQETCLNCGNGEQIPKDHAHGK
jgi:hypothetical protein